MSTAADEAFLAIAPVEQEVIATEVEPEGTPEGTPEGIPEGIPEEETEKEKYSKRVQKRIDKEIYEKNELKRRIEALESQLNTKPEVKTLPNGAPDPEQFLAGRYDPDYLEALTDFKVKIALDKEHKSVVDSQRNKQVQEMVEKASSKYNDFEDVTTEFTSHPLTEIKEFTDLVMESENPIELAYFLGKNVQEMDKLANMTLAQATRYLGRLEAQINTEVPLSLVQKKTATNAPKPLTPLKGASVTNIKDPEKMSVREYEAYIKQNS